MSVPILLLTRPAAASARIAAAATARFGDRLRVLVAPVLEIVEDDAPIPLDGVQGLVFTSENAVDAFARHSARRDLPAWCVGDRTAAAARAAGLAAHSAAGDAAALARLIVAEGVRGPLLHLAGDHVRGDLPGDLAAAGIALHVRPVYRQQARPLTASARAALGGRDRVIVPLFSPRSAALFRAEAGMPLAPLDLVAISLAAAEPLAGWGAAHLCVARRPDADAVLDAVAERLAADPSA